MADSIAELLDFTLRVAGKIDKAAGKCMVYIEAADIFLGYGHKSRCLATLAEALRILESIKHPDEKAKILAWVARLFWETGDQAKGKELFTRATLLARAAESISQKFDALYRIAGEYVDVGLNDGAVSLLTELYAAVINPDSQIDAAAELINIAEIYTDLGREDKTDTILEEALEAVAGVEDSWFKAERWTEIAELYAATGKKDHVQPILADLLSVIGRVDRVSQPHFLLKAAEIQAASGEKEKALQMLAKARETIDQDELPYSRAVGYIETAGIYTQLEDDTTATYLLSQAAEIISGRDGNKDQIAGFIRIASALKQLGANQQSLDLANQALLLCQSLADNKARLYLLGNLSLLFFELDEKAKAQETVSHIIQFVQETGTKTSGLGVIAAELAAAGEYIPALRLAQLIREPEAKTSALTAACRSLVEDHQEPGDGTKQIIRELVNNSPSL